MLSEDIQDAIDRIIEGPVFELDKLNERVAKLEAVARAARLFAYDHDAHELQEALKEVEE